MPTLEEELFELEKQEEENFERFSRFKSVERMRIIVQAFLFIFSIAIVVSVVALLRIWYKGGLPLDSDDYFLIGFYSFYPGAFAFGCLFTWLSSSVDNFISRRFAATGPDWAKTKTDLQNISTKKTVLKGRIQYRDKQKVVEDERKNERNKEREFLYRINDLVYKVLSQDITLDEANTLAEQLREENRTFWLRGYLLYNKNFYDERFAKIEEGLKRNFPLNSTDHNSPNIKTPNVTTQKNLKLGELQPINLEKTGKEEIPKADTFIPEATKANSTTNEKVQDVKLVSSQDATNGKTIVHNEGTPTSKTQVPTERKLVVTGKTEENKKDPVKVEKTPEQKNSDDQGKLIEEVPISELFATPLEKVIRKEYKKQKPPFKQDYLKLQEHRQSIGELGEEFAIAWEKTRLISKGLYRFRDNIVHTSKTDDSAGYDFITYFDDGRPKYVEVKTTVGDFLTPFYLSENEVNAIKQHDNYFIYRVFDFDISSGVGEIFTMGKEDIKQYFQFEPTAYRVIPKR